MDFDPLPQSQALSLSLNETSLPPARIAQLSSALGPAIFGNLYVAKLQGRRSVAEERFWCCAEERGEWGGG